MHTIISTVLTYLAPVILTKAGRPKRKLSPEDKLNYVGMGSLRELTLARVGDYRRLFAFRVWNGIATTPGEGPGAFTWCCGDSVPDTEGEETAIVAHSGQRQFPQRSHTNIIQFVFRGELSFWPPRLGQNDRGQVGQYRGDDGVHGIGPGRKRDGW